MKFDAHQFWIASIPTSWHWNRVSESFQVINGFPFASENFNSNGDGLPLVRIRDILSSDFTTFYSGQNGLDVVVNDGDIVIGMDGDFNSSWWGKGVALLNQRVAALRSKPKQQVDARFAYYQIPFGLKVINDLTPSSTVKHLSSGDIGALRLPTPDLPAQKRIAAFLDREKARIDELIAKKKRLVEVSAEARFSTISRAVTVGLNPDVMLNETESQYIPRVPDGWRVWRLKHLARAFGGITLGRKLDSDEPVFPTPYLRVANVQAGWLNLSDVAEIEATEKERRRYALQAGDVLMNEGGDNDKLGRGAVWNAPFEPCITQNHVFVVRPKDIRLSEWISLATNARYARDFFFLHSNQSTNLASISKTNLERFPIAVPPMAEMKKCLAILSDRLDLIERTVTTTKASIDRLFEYRAALITAAVTGQIDVNTYGKAGTTSATLDQIEEELQP